MAADSTSTVFIHGVQKSATSTLVGLLNSHPDIFILYETMLHQQNISKYGNQLLASCPEARECFKLTGDISEPYLKLADLLEEKLGKRYAYVGDKFLSFNAYAAQPEANKVIFIMRDIRTWAAKPAIRDIYRTDIDLVRPAIGYLKYIINARRTQKTLCLRMEDMVKDSAWLAREIGDYLGLKFDEQGWWKNVGQYAVDDPKSWQSWYKTHPSATVAPKKFDMKVELAQHPFWDEFLPVFDKYYSHNTGKAVNEKEALKDLEFIESLARYSCLPYNQLYNEINQTQLSSIKTSYKVGKKLKKVLRAISPR